MTTPGIKAILTGIANGTITSWSDPIFDRYRTTSNLEISIIKKALDKLENDRKSLKNSKNNS